LSNARSNADLTAEACPLPTAIDRNAIIDKIGGGDRLFGKISPKLPMNTFSAVVAASTVSVIARLTALPVRSRPLKPFSDFLGTTIGMATAVTLGTLISLPAQATTLFRAC